MTTKTQNKGPAGTDGGTDDQQDQEDLELDADEDEGDGTDGGGDDDTDDDSVEAQVRRALTSILPEIQKGYRSEIDRRISGVVKKLRPKAPADGQDEDEDEDGDDAPPPKKRRTAPAPVQADERGARVAFREYLPGNLKFLSEEERRSAIDYGQLLISAEARKGFDDEDLVGRDVAQKVADHVKSQRKFYSERTKRTLERQGALVKQEGNGGGAGGGSIPPATVDEAWKKAEERRRKLYPHQFKDDKK